MALVEGTQVGLFYLKESSWAVPGGTAYTVVRKQVGASTGETRTSLSTSETNTRRALTSIRLGARSTTVSVPFELSYHGDATAGSQQFDDFLESWMVNAWAAAASAIAAQTVTVGTPAATTVFTAGTSIGTIAVGDWIRVSGFTTTQITNNSYYRVSAVNTLALTLVTPNYSTMVAGAAAGTAVVLQRMAYISPGTTVKSIAFDEAFTDIASSLVLSKMAIGCIANSFSLTINPDAIITGSFEFIGRVLGRGATRAAAASDASRYSTITAAASWPAASARDVMTANDTLAVLMVNNAAVAVVTALTINGSNDIESLFPVGATCPYGLGKGNSMLSGTMSIYLVDATWWASYNTETAVGLSVMLMDPDLGTLSTREIGRGYSIDIPNIKITALTETKDPKKVIQEVTWTATELATANTKGAATVNMRVSRLTYA